jgi:hypothetical protein
LLIPIAALFAVTLVTLRLRNQPPDLPGYTLTLEGEAGTKSPSPLRVGGPLELVLRPTGKVTGAVGARAFFVRDGKGIVWETAKPHVTPDGTVRLTGILDPPLPPGEWDLAVAVGRLEMIPLTPELIVFALQNDEGAPTGGWVLLHHSVQIMP